MAQPKHLQGRSKFETLKRVGEKLDTYGEIVVCLSRRN